MYEKESENVINLLDIFNVLRMRWLYILISGILLAAISFCYFSFFVPEQYSASAQLFIDIRKVSSEGKDTYINSTHITTAKELASTYAHIIETNIVLDEVIDELDLNMNMGALASKINISIIEDTPVLRVSVIDTDYNRALKIVTKVIEVAPDVINAKIDSGKLIAIDKPTVSTTPVSPNITRNTLIAFIVGAGICYGIFLFIRMIDNKIKTPDDIQRVLDMPFLGVIPSLEHIQKKK